MRRAANGRVFDAVLRLLYMPGIALFPFAVFAVAVIVRPPFGWDFRALYQAGHAYLHLRSPYVSGSLAQLTSQENFVYPLPIAAIFAPVSLLPYTVAAALFVSVSAVLLVLTVWLLGVRDWRCYLAVFAGIPAFDALGLGTISPLLAFLLALLWRFRDRSAVAVPALSLLVLTKLFLWPAGLWLLLTRRFRTVTAATIACASAVVVSALPLGLGALTHYVALLRSLSGFELPISFSLASLGTNLGRTSLVGVTLTVAAGSLLLLGMVRAARLGDDSRAFRLSIVAALAMSPIVWNHYLVLLYVPLALTRPRFSALWLAPAWIMGALLGHTALAVLTVVVWVIILIASGVLARHPAPDRKARQRLPGPVLAFAGSLCLWFGLVWLVVTLSAAVQGAAALNTPRNGGSASGTALLRLIKGRNEICWRILTSGLPTHTRAEITENGKGTVLVRTPMQAGRSDTCVRYAPTAGKENLAQAFKTGRVHLSLRIVSPAGRPLLYGRIVSKLSDLTT